MKKFIVTLLAASLVIGCLTGCGGKKSTSGNGEVVVYNWGEYIDPDVIAQL